MNAPAVEIPLYRCHKVVRAAKITGFRQNGIPDAPDLLLGEIGGVVSLISAWHAKHQPQPGGYYVVYEDGYKSYSPAKAFEEGYTQIHGEHHPLDRIARVCHEVNRAYCLALGDDSQPAWEDAPAWQRESARMGVDLHLSGDFGPEASHIGWMQQKLADGWTYGAEKNPELKQHPYMVPFADLPREQQAKDFIFRAVVHALR